MSPEEVRALVQANAAWAEHEFGHEPRVRFQRPECTKKPYGSAHAVRMAHASAGFRVRAYRCPACGSWHATKGDRTHHHP